MSAPALLTTIRIGAGPPSGAPTILIGNQVVIHALFFDGVTGRATDVVDPSITVQPPATTSNPTPDPITYTPSSAPPLVSEGAGAWFIAITPGWTGTWGAISACSLPFPAAATAAFLIVVSPYAVPAPVSPGYPTQALLDPVGSSVIAGAVNGSGHLIFTRVNGTAQDGGQITAAAIGAAPATLASIPLALPGSVTAAAHANATAVLSGAGALSIAAGTFPAGTGCLVLNSTSAAVTVTATGFVSTAIGTPGFGATQIVAGGLAVVVATSDGAGGTVLNIQGGVA